MSTRSLLGKHAAALALAAGALLPGIVSAQQAMPAAGTWRFGAAVYGYLPTISANTSFPTTGSAGSSIAMFGAVFRW